MLHFGKSTAIGGLFALLLSTSAFAAGHAQPDTVIATVNGTDITMGHLVGAKAALPEQYRSLADDVLFDGLLEQLIQQSVLAGTITDIPPKAVIDLENARRNALATVAVEQLIAAPVDQADLQAAYDAQYGNIEPESEFNASHILVETEEEAIQIKELLDGGSDFADMAKDRSTGPSGPNGGSLGWFGKGQMVPPFEAAAAAMEAGDISAPVKTQFGWHVIKMNETRVKEAPTLESVQDQLRSEIQSNALKALVDGLVEKAEVVRLQDAVDPSFLSNPDFFDK